MTQTRAKFNLSILADLLLGPFPEFLCNACAAFRFRLGGQLQIVSKWAESSPGYDCR